MFSQICTVATKIMAKIEEKNVLKTDLSLIKFKNSDSICADDKPPQKNLFDY